MICSNCGTQNNQGAMFCSNCGMRLENTPQQQPQPMNYQTNPQQPMNQQPMNNSMNQQTYQQPQQNGNMQYSNNNWTPNQNQAYIDKAVNPNMKKWAIISIVVPIVAIIWYWFIGLSFYIAIFIAAAGFGFAQKGEMANKKMAIIGKVLNGILAGMAIIMLILQLIAAFTK